MSSTGLQQIVRARPSVVQGGKDDMGALSSALPTAELGRRPSRPPDFVTENRALVELARELAERPGNILQKLADTALTLCRAETAGVSLLDGEKKRFYWPAISGRWASHRGGGTPRDFGPCGTVLDRDTALLFSHPERDFPYFRDVQPPLEDGLLIPFHVNGEAVGTIWVVLHDPSRRFEAEDLRLMTNLGAFAAAAYQSWLSLHASEHFGSIIQSSDDAIVGKDIEGIITSWNPGAERIFGYTSREAIGRPITLVIPPELRGEEQDILARLRRGERIEHYETTRRRKDGSAVEVSLTVSPIKNAEGRVVGASKIARDITERKRSEQQIAALAQEAEHRAKNVLATVQATIHLSHADTTEGLKRAIEGRIQALSIVHSLFVQSRWSGADLRSLVTQELAPYHQDNEARVVLDGPDLWLEPGTAQTIAVTMHELATNAAKYGALSVAEGHVLVEWSRTADGRLAMRWTEIGGPPAKPPVRPGFGTRVMKSMIAGQAKGEIRHHWRPEGLICEFTVPV
jgi:PAS domain S-box-containing protein